MDDHDEEKRREQNVFVRSDKSEVEVVLEASCDLSATARLLISSAVTKINGAEPDGFTG